MTPWTAAHQASLSFTICQSLFKLMSIEKIITSTVSPSVILHSFCPQSFPASGTSPVSWLYVSAGQRIGASALASSEYSGLILFRIYWFDSLDVQGTLKSILQYHNLKARILQHSAFFMVQLTHPYMITGKTITLTIQTFVSKMIS